MPPERLVAPSARRAVLVVVVVAVAVVAALGIWLHGKTATPVDTDIERFLYAHLQNRSVIRDLLQLTDPAFDVGVLGTVAVAASLRRAWSVAVLAVGGPVLATVISEAVLKPLIGRSHGVGGYGYPSGHETGLVALLTVLAILALRTTWRLALKIAIVVIFVIWAALAAVGLVRNFLHYPTDTVGGAGVGIAVVLLVALVTDAVAARRVNAPDVPDRSRTVHAA